MEGPRRCISLLTGQKFLLSEVLVRVVSAYPGFQCIGYFRLSDLLQAFILMITLEYKNVEDRDLYIKLFQLFAKYFIQHELGTLQFELCIADKNPLKLIIFERYVGVAFLYYNACLACQCWTCQILKAEYSLWPQLLRDKSVAVKGRSHIGRCYVFIDRTRRVPRSLQIVK